MEIEDITFYRVQNSRADWTVAAAVNDSRAAAPSGASAGSHEAQSFVPDDLGAVEDEIRDRVKGQDLDQKEFDSLLHEVDGSAQFSRIGSAGIAASMAFRQARGFAHDGAFPYPLGNVVGGGEHGGNTAIQEFLVIPVGADSFLEAVETNAEIYREVRERYATKVMGMNDEGALVTRMDDLETLKAVKKVAHDHGARVGLDLAANELWDGESYTYPELNMDLPPEEQRKFVSKLIEDHDIYYVEDPFHEEDFKRHAELRRQHDCLVVGDDLFVTNTSRLERGIEEGACNALIVKPNQVGTVSEALETVEMAREADYLPVISHRSGETCDTTISSLALEWDLPIIKAGITDIRVAKLNMLSRVWQQRE
ncbi:MAG: enolase C-terminal domain-like protein [Candidatus Nanohaloarchaea archaeon]|nr:enolase C-terminal domain-like protein [Candidatus Nanohaloarchaea archaeon]